MQKKSKTILTAVVTALFVLSVSYFALLAPTTAWYYQTEDKTFSFEFGDFDMTNALKTGEQQIANITFRGATRFADAGEELFDEMLHIIKVVATNNGDTPGSVRVAVKRQVNGDVVDMPLDNADGLRWFVYEPDANASVKDQIDDMLTAWNPDWPIDYNDLTGPQNAPYTDYDPANGEAESAYELYNIGTTASGAAGTYSGGAMEALIAYNKHGVTVPDNSTRDVYVAFWVEYGAAKTPLYVGDSASQRDTTIPSLTFNDLTIEIKAMPDIGGTDTTSLTINNRVSAYELGVKLYQYTNTWTLYTDAGGNTDSEGLITIPASGSKTIGDLPVGARFRVVIQGTPPVHFVDNGDLQDVTIDGMSITGALSNGTNSILIDPNAS